MLRKASFLQGYKRVHSQFSSCAFTVPFSRCFEMFIRLKQKAPVHPTTYTISLLGTFICFSKTEWKETQMQAQSGPSGPYLSEWAVLCILTQVRDGESSLKISLPLSFFLLLSLSFSPLPSFFPLCKIWHVSQISSKFIISYNLEQQYKTIREVWIFIAHMNDVATTLHALQMKLA